jgi:phosphate transport system permease protein
VNWAFFTHLPRPTGEIGGGMANDIVGTFELLGLAALIGVPVGVLGGVYLSEYGTFRLNWWIRLGADVLNGVPSIIWGIVVYALVVVPMHGFSAWAGGIVLGMMMVALIMRTTEEVLQLVPNGYREAALALGIAQWRTILQIIIRTAGKGIVTGVLLAVARVAGETAPLLFTAMGNQYWNRNLSDPISALPLRIFNYAISPYPDLWRQAWAGALVLLLLITIINVGVRVLTRERFQKNT